MFSFGAPAAPTTGHPVPATANLNPSTNQFGAAPAVANPPTFSGSAQLGFLPATDKPTPVSSNLFGSTPSPAPLALFGKAPASLATPSLFDPKKTPVQPAVAPTFGLPTMTPVQPAVAPTFGLPTMTPFPGTGQAVDKAVKVDEIKPVGSISSLKNKTLEEIVNKWSTELDTHTREFHRQAIQVQKWDDGLVSNGAAITKLFNDLIDVESAEKEIDQNLEYIDAQQMELERSLETYAKQVQNMIAADQNNPNSRFRATPADEDREKAYTLAEHLNSKLDDMTSSLSVVIEELNATRRSDTSALDESPLQAITQILNSHLTSLEWIERSSIKLEAKVEALKATTKKTNV